MRQYFHETAPQYQTRGVASDVHPFLVVKCVELLDELIGHGIEPDYLQVFRIRYETSTNILYIKHTQEEPDYSKEIGMYLPTGVTPYEGKLYYIDDGEHRTFLKAEEY